MRITLIAKDERGGLARMSKAIADAGGNIVASVEVPGTNSTNYEVLMKVTGVSKEALVEAVQPVAVRIINVREDKKAMGSIRRAGKELAGGVYPPADSGDIDHLPADTVQKPAPASPTLAPTSSAQGGSSTDNWTWSQIARSPVASSCQPGCRLWLLASWWMTP